MPIQIAKSAGFCMGVNRAVKTALEVADKAKADGDFAFSLGELIHNPTVVLTLKEQGLTPVSSPEEAKDGILVIRSHGTSPDLIAQCRLNAKKVVDCTCPFVHHVHMLVEEHSKNGSPVIILGDPDHPEIKGIVGWCSGEHYVIHHAEQIDELPESAGGALLVSQTTFPPSAWDTLLPKLIARFPGLRYENTICKATNVRQAEAEALAKTSDKMIVVGGKQSANTRKLAETCQKWCPRTYLVEHAGQLDAIELDPANEMIGITAGASTPAWSLKEVVDYMNDKELKGQALNPETPDQLIEAQDTAAEATEVIADEVKANMEAAQTVADEVSQASDTTAEEVVQTMKAEAETVTESVADVVEKPADTSEKEAPKKPSFMDEVAASMSRIRTGQTISGKVVQITEDEVCVNIGYKSDGLLKRVDMVDKDVELGDEIEVEVVKVNDGEGNVILSQRNIVNRKVWNDLMVKYESGELVDAIGKEAVKGGLLANIDGVRAFIPASHLAQRYVDKITQFVGQEMKLKIIEVDQSKKRVVASRKEALAVESETIKEAVWSQLEEGSVIKGVVRRSTNFGAFVDLGGVDGLIHVSDLSWNRSVVPSDILQVNEEVEVKILSLDRERDRIALGFKQLQPRPWDNVEEKYPVGTVLTRKIVRVRPFGACIELEPGVDGLVHISQVSPTRIEKIEDAIQPGQEVNVKVLAVDPVAKRISLSIREAMEDSALQYDAEIPGDSLAQKADVTQEDSGIAPASQESEAAPSTDESRPETTLELAMRKAREEFDSQEEEKAEEES